MIVRRCAQDHDVVLHLNNKPEMTKTILTLDRGMSAMYMLLASHDEVLKHLVDRVENLENLLQVSKGGLVQ